MTESISAKEDSLRTARILLSVGCANLRPSDPFVLTSGKRSPVYMDCRRLIAFPAERNIIMDMAAARIKARDIPYDMVAGGETAGIPYAAFLAERLDLPMAYIRKKPKGFGKNARIEGAPENASRAILIEDLSTDGGSKISFAEGLRDANIACEDCFVIFKYDLFPEKEKTIDLRIEGLSNWQAVRDVARQDNLLSSEDLRSLDRFIENPESWEA